MLNRELRVAMVPLTPLVVLDALTVVLSVGLPVALVLLPPLVWGFYLEE